MKSCVCLLSLTAAFLYPVLLAVAEDPKIDDADLALQRDDP